MHYGPSLQMIEKAIKETAENYPDSAFYKTEDLLTQMGIGEALITLLNEKGIPTPLAHTYMIAPRSRMDILSEVEINDLVSRSKLIPKYNNPVDRESAYELLNAKLTQAANLGNVATTTSSASTSKASSAKVKEEKSWIETALNSAAGKQMQRSVVRGLFGVIQKMFK